MHSRLHRGRHNSSSLTRRQRFEPSLEVWRSHHAANLTHRNQGIGLFVTFYQAHLSPRLFTSCYPPLRWVAGPGLAAATRTDARNVAGWQIALYTISYRISETHTRNIWSARAPPAHIPHNHDHNLCSISNIKTKQMANRSLTQVGRDTCAHVHSLDPACRISPHITMPYPPVTSILGVSRLLCVVRRGISWLLKL